MDSSNPVTTASTEFDLPNFIAAFPIALLGGERVAIYMSTNQQNEKQYFYQPLLLPDWSAYESNIDEVCAGKKEDEELTARITIETMRQNYLEELMAQLRANGHAPTLINPFPHAFFQIFADFGDRTVLITDEFIPSAGSGISLQPGAILSNRFTFEVKGSCLELRSLYERREVQNSLSGQLFAQGFAYSTDFVEIGAKFVSSEQIRTEIFGDETKEHRVVTNSTSRGGGFSVNLGVVQFGGGGSDGQIRTTQSDQRILSRDYLSEVVSKHRADLNLFVQGDPERTQELVKTFVSALLGLMDKVTVNIEKTSDQQWNLVNGAVTYATLSALEISEMQSMAPEQTATASETTSVAIPEGPTVSRATTGDFTTKNSIVWQFDGQNWIPTSVNLVILSKQEFSSETYLTAQLVHEEGQRATATKFIYPANYWVSQSDAPAPGTSPATGTIVISSEGLKAVVRQYTGDILLRGWISGSEDIAFLDNIRLAKIDHSLSSYAQPYTERYTYNLYQAASDWVGQSLADPAGANNSFQWLVKSQWTVGCGLLMWLIRTLLKLPSTAFLPTPPMLFLNQP